GQKRARRARAALLERRFGPAAERAAAVERVLSAELRRHAMRVAQIQRIAAIAEEKDDDALAERAEVLLELERALHHARLARIGEGAPAGDETRGEESE
ncbi:MAG: hypothetical protein ACODAU_12430, partial [Myxococcota bacterium]